MGNDGNCSEHEGTSTPERLSGDRPRERLSQDRLGYANFARTMAKAIASMTPRDGVVLAIHGPWGSGKTSTVNMIVDALDESQRDIPETNRILVVRFNPWWFSEQQDLARVFFAEISAALGTKVSNDVKDGLRKVAKHVSGAKDLILSALSFVPAGELAKTAVGEIIGMAGGALDTDRSLDDERKLLQDALKKEGKRILVIIDDVDRLPADEARQIFRLVKSVADLPNMIYLLVFDREIASRALERPAYAEGPEWLEKIVQASFDLPPIHPVDLQYLFFEGLAQIHDGRTLDRTRWGNVFFDAVNPWLRTPRDVTRLLNALTVSWPAVEGEVDFTDFVAIETMRMFEPRLHALIKQSAGELTGLSRNSAYERKTTIGDQIYAVVDEGKRPTVRRALERLFPRLESVWGNHSYSDGFLDQWDRQRRICSPKRFPAYFIFGVGDDALPKRELDRLRDALPDAAALEAIIIEYAQQPRRSGGTQASVLLDEIGTIVAEIPQDQVGASARSLLFACDHFLGAIDDRASFFSIPTLWRISWLIKELLEKLEATEEIALLREAINNSPSLATTSFIVIGYSIEHGRHSNKPAKPEDQRRLDEPTVLALERLLTERFERSAADGSLIASREALYLMHTWASVGGDAAVRNWTESLLADNASAVRLAEVVTTTSRSHALGDNVTREIPTVNRAGLAAILDVDRLAARVQEFPIPDEGSQKIIERFLQGLGRGLIQTQAMTTETRAMAAR